VHLVSPYRSAPASPEPPVRRGPSAARPRLTTSRGAFAISLLVHVAAFIVALRAPTTLHRDLPPDQDPPGPQLGLYLHAESRPAFPLPPWVQACFGRTELPAPVDCMRPEYDLPESEPFGYLEDAEKGWARVEISDLTFPDLDSASLSVGEATRDCFEHASYLGWSGAGRVFVRAERRADGTAIATTAALDGAPRGDAILCCLRQAQAPLVSILGPGGAVRFVIAVGVEPGRPYLSITRAATSRRGGGPEALAALQRAFSD
jgi:hypothetical protein